MTRRRGDFWSPSWQPTRVDVEDYQCRHGLGYTVIASRRAGIDVETLYFVPLGETLEIWRSRLTNRRDTAVQLSLFSAVEFCLWDAWDDATNLQRNLSIGEVEVDDGVIYHTTEYRERRNHFAYFACSAELGRLRHRSRPFLGPYRGWDRPTVVERGRSCGSIAHGWAPCGSHHVELEARPRGNARDRLPARVRREPGRRQVRPARVAADRQAPGQDGDPALPAAGRGRCGIPTACATTGRTCSATLHVSTPNEHADRMVNIWNPYQCMVTFNLSRSASLFETGLGRGMGFRDSNQDLLGFVHMVPDRARERILDIAATQLPSGGAYHQYQPLTKRGNDAIGSGFNDDPLWLILAVAAYLKETGDGGILDEQVPFDNEPGSESLALRAPAALVGLHARPARSTRLPLIGRADWNDCLNLNCFSTTPGESFQTTENRRAASPSRCSSPGCSRWPPTSLRGSPSTTAATMTPRDASRHATTWLRRCASTDGTERGSGAPTTSSALRSARLRNAEGQIYIEPQGMCVMAGIGLDDDRAGARSTRWRRGWRPSTGSCSCSPPIRRYHVELGEISSYPPGYKENGSVFCHTNPWIMIAETLVGNGDRAFDYYLRINPSAREQMSDVHRCEPYVYAQMIAGKDAPTHGEAKNSWLTGTAAWNFVALTQHILGIRPQHDGLRVDPRVPANWPGFNVIRQIPRCHVSHRCPQHTHDAGPSLQARG